MKIQAYPVAGDIHFKGNLTDFLLPLRLDSDRKKREK